jgi:hypothetical protein
VGTSVRVWLHLAILLILWRMYRRRRGDGTPLAACVLPAFMGALAAYYIGGLTFDYRYFVAPNAIFYLLWGVIVGWEARWRAGRAPAFANPT